MGLGGNILDWTRIQTIWMSGTSRDNTHAQIKRCNCRDKGVLGRHKDYTVECKNLGVVG